MGWRLSIPESSTPVLEALGSTFLATDQFCGQILEGIGAGSVLLVLALLQERVDGGPKRNPLVAFVFAKLGETLGVADAPECRHAFPPARRGLKLLLQLTAGELTFVQAFLQHPKIFFKLRAGLPSPTRSI